MTDYRLLVLRKAARQEARNTVRFSDDTEEEDTSEPDGETEHSKVSRKPSRQTDGPRDIGKLDIQDESENEEPERKGKSLQRRQEHRTGGTKRG
jgi:hypothetical protein